jgi:uncharacterized membrane protein
MCKHELISVSMISKIVTDKTSYYLLLMFVVVCLVQSAQVVSKSGVNFNTTRAETLLAISSKG